MINAIWRPLTSSIDDDQGRSGRARGEGQRERRGGQRPSRAGSTSVRGAGEAVGSMCAVASYDGAMKACMLTGKHQLDWSLRE